MIFIMKNFNLKDYCFNLFDTMVANKLFRLLHVITQVFFIAVMLIAVMFSINNNTKEIKESLAKSEKAEKKPVAKTKK